MQCIHVNYDYCSVATLLTKCHLSSIGCETIHRIGENASIVSLICLHSINYSQAVSGSTTVVGTINQISSILLPLVGEVAASSFNCESDVCPWNHIPLTCRIRSDGRAIN